MFDVILTFCLKQKKIIRSSETLSCYLQNCFSCSMPLKPFRLVICSLYENTCIKHTIFYLADDITFEIDLRNSCSSNIKFIEIKTKNKLIQRYKIWLQKLKSFLQNCQKWKIQTYTVWIYDFDLKINRGLP